ncbi:hypothetical protein PDQ76_25570 [Bacillus cereus]|nr:hypothetical protein [Bacillus cereus]
MTIQIDNVVIGELDKWKEEFLNHQGEQERKLQELENELKVIKVKRYCLYNVKQKTDGFPGVQEQIVKTIFSQIDTRYKWLLDEIEKIKTNNMIQKSIDEMIFSEIDNTIKVASK